MSELSAHHASARKIVMAVELQLTELETGCNTSLALQSEISQNLNTLAREIATLEGLLPTSEGAAQRSLWRKRITQLSEQSNSQRASLGKFAGNAARHQREHEEREALLQRRHGAGQHAITIDAQARESRNLHDAGSQLDELSANAGAVLGALGQQRSALKGVHRKVLDMAQTLGLSGSVLRAIERRQFFDRLLVYGGMLLTLALLWFVFVHRLR